MFQKIILLLLVGLATQTGFSQILDIDNTVLPKKTEIFIELKRSLNSKTVRPGDRFPSIVTVPVTQNDEIVIPSGSWILGRVVGQETAGYLEGKSSLLLSFDTLILPDGKTRLMRAAVESAEGYQTDAEAETGELVAAGSQKEEVATGAAKGAVTGVITGATIGLLSSGTGAASGAGLGAAVGAAGGALLGLIKKGEEVELPKGTSLTIQLQEATQFVQLSPPTNRTVLEP